MCRIVQLVWFLRWEFLRVLLTNSSWITIGWKWSIVLFKILLIVHNCLKGNAPQDILQLITYGDSQRTLHLRETKYNNKYGCRSFSHSGPKLWNLLPKSIRCEIDTDLFKKKLKTFLMLRGEEYHSWINRHWRRMSPSSVPYTHC